MFSIALAIILAASSLETCDGMPTFALKSALLLRSHVEEPGGVDMAALAMAIEAVNLGLEVRLVDTSGEDENSPAGGSRGGVEARQCQDRLWEET